VTRVREWTPKGPDETIEAVRSFDGPVLVDLDETLYLTNSTEDFIDSVRPGLAVACVLRLLDALKPWRWTGGEVTRDVWRVGVVSLLFPWAGRAWRARVGIRATEGVNARLASVLRGRHTPPTIVTIGFRPIVEPLVAALGFAGARVVAARLSLADRVEGKLAIARKALGEEAIRRSLVVTDSIDDAPLLEVCACPCLTRWPDARYVPALARVYLPGEYLGRVKRPGQRYILRAIVQEDFAYWVLASIALAGAPAAHVLGLFGLLVSFWSIYERGYVDNDLVGRPIRDRPEAE